MKNTARVTYWYSPYCPQLLCEALPIFLPSLATLLTEPAATSVLSLTRKKNRKKNGTLCNGFAWNEKKVCPTLILFFTITHGSRADLQTCTLAEISFALAVFPFTTVLCKVSADWIELRSKFWSKRNHTANSPNTSGVRYCKIIHKELKVCLPLHFLCQ